MLPISLASVQSSTIATYSPTLKKWWQFCWQNHILPFSPNVSQVLSFLLQEYNAGLAYRTLNCTRAALSIILQPPLMEDSRIRRFYQGLAHLRPATPRYNVTWDPQLVLDYFRSQPPTNRLALPDLSRKLITLLALTTGHRMQTFSKITLSNICLASSKVDIFISARLKTSRHNRPQPILTLPVFSENQLCAASALRHYLEVTKPLRNNTEQLFIATCPPFKPVSPQTLSRWVKEVLAASGVDACFTAHSARHAATSAAFRGGATIETIRNAAGWTPSSETFAKFYHRDIVPRSTPFAAAVFKK